MYTGVAVFKSAYIAMMGARMPKMRLLEAVNALPVPRCNVGNTSGVYAYKTAYLDLQALIHLQVGVRVKLT